MANQVDISSKKKTNILLNTSFQTLAIIGLIATQHGAASAEAASAAANTEELKEIVVTATKRAESVQKVAASITAVSGEALAQQRITQPADLAGISPNLQSNAAPGEGDTNYALRGITLNDLTTSQQGPIAIFYDEVYKGGRPLQGITLYDLERVEVLKGPQSTLYGQNASGGAINFISKRPGFKPEGNISIGTGNFGRFEASGAAQTGITDQLAVRFAFTTVNADGWFKNVYPGQPNPSSTDYYGMRASLLYNATEKLNFVLRASTSKMNGTNYGLYADTSTPTPCFGFGTGVGCGIDGSYFRNGLGKWQVDQNYVPKALHETHAIALTASWDMTDHLKLVSVSSFDHGIMNSPQDGDGSPLSVFAVAKQYTNMKQFTQELRAVTDSSGPFNLIIGGYYSRENSSNETTYTYKTDVSLAQCDLSILAACISDTNFRQLKKTLAVYGDASFKFTDKLTLRGGLRYTHASGFVSRYNGGYYNFSDGSLFALNIDNLRESYSVNPITGKVSLDYQITPDKMIYASYSTGFRSPAFNAAAADNPGQVPPTPAEFVKSIEAGFKSQWFDRMMTLNGAVFNYQYTSQQSINLINGVAFLYPIPKSHVLGAELELTLQPVKALRLRGSVGYEDTEIKRGTATGLSGTLDLAGNRLPLTSKWTGMAGFDWDVVNGDSGKVTLGANTTYQSKMYFDIFNTERLAQKSYALVNATLRYRTPSDKYGLTFWVRNLTNKFYFTGKYDTSFFGADTGSLGAPRTFGATLDAKF